MPNIEQIRYDLKSLWINSIKNLQYLKIPKQLFFNLIKNVSPIKLENNVLYVHCYNTVLSHAVNQYRNEILQELRKNDNLTKLQSIFIDNEKVDKIPKNNVDKSELEIQYAWRYFENDEAIKLIKSFIEGNDQTLFIYGQKNAGKSFLLDRILEYLRINCRKNVEKFNSSTINYIDIEKGPMYVLIDNIEDFSDQKITFIFELILHNKKNKFIITCHSLPNKLIDQFIVHKKYYRTVHLIPINRITIDKILKNNIKFAVYPEAYTLMIDFLLNDPKSIDRLLSTIELFYQQNNQKVINKSDIDMLLQILDIDLKTKKVDKLIKEIANKLNVSIEAIRSENRSKKYVTARSIVAYILRRKKNMTLNDIGKYLNRSSHSTIINLINFYEQKLVDNVDISRIIDSIDTSYI